MSTVYNVIFRTCDSVESLHAAPRPFGLDKKSVLKICFLGLRRALGPVPHTIHVLGDRLSEESQAFFRRFPVTISNQELGNDASIRASLDRGFQYPDGEWLYFCEDDYLHRPETFAFIDRFLDQRRELLEKAGRAGAPPEAWLLAPLFIHPPDYPDRYLPRYRRPSLLFTSPDCHWREVDRTTFTLMGEVASFRRFRGVLERSAHRANDTLLSRGLFGRGLLSRKGLCLSPLPGLSTHLHEPVMTPLVDWGTLAADLLGELAALESVPGQLSERTPPAP